MLGTAPFSALFITFFLGPTTFDRWYPIYILALMSYVVITTILNIILLMRARQKGAYLISYNEIGAIIIISALFIFLWYIILVWPYLSGQA